MTGPQEPLWSVLIATLASRQTKLARLLDVLLPAAEVDGGIEVVALHNNGERSVGAYRQALLEDARGEYVSFVDDDDLVEDGEDGYIPAVAAAMRGTHPDYIAFQHAYYEDGKRDPHPVVTGIGYNGWYDTPTEYVRDITHVNPVRAVLARKAGFTDMGSGEDYAYDTRLRPLLRTEARIDRALYHYFHSWSDSVQARLAAHDHTPRLTVTSPVFRWSDR